MQNRPTGRQGQPNSRDGSRRPTPSGYGQPVRRPGQPPRQHRKAKPKFFLIIAILTVVLIAGAVGVILLRKPAGTVAPQATTAPQASETQTPAVAAETTEASTSTEAETVTYVDTTGLSNDEIAAMLGSDDYVGTLDESQRIQVTDLSVTQKLSDEWLNVLLLGTDERDLAEKGRTDSMIICSINTKTGAVKLTSIMRDLAIDYTQMGFDELGTYRINAANYFGGPELAMKTVNYNFGMNIENYVLINFYGFQDVIEVLGGIDMDITEAEMEQINKWQRQVAKIMYDSGMDVFKYPNEDLTVYGDNVHLNGQQALAYARIRKIDSDYGRADRQRKVLIAVMDKLKTKSALELAQLATQMLPYVTTNLDPTVIVNIAYTVLASNLNGDTLRLPVNGTYVEEKRNNDAMLYDCDFTTNRQELYDFIFQ